MGFAGPAPPRRSPALTLLGYAQARPPIRGDGAPEYVEGKRAGERDRREAPVEGRAGTVSREMAAPPISRDERGLERSERAARWAARSGDAT